MRPRRRPRRRRADGRGHRQRDEDEDRACGHGPQAQPHSCAASAMSSATPSRPIGCAFMATLRALSTSLPACLARAAKLCAPISVSITPGWIELTRLFHPLPAKERAADLVNSVTPPLVIE